MTNTLLLPVLPLRDIVVFPHMVVPLFVGRAASMSALEAAMEQGKQILLVTQKNPDSETPRTEELYTHGCQANILQLLKLPDGNVRVLVEGQRRVQLSNVRMESDYLVAESHVLVEQVLDNEKFKALQQTAIEQFSLYGKLSAKITDEVVATSHKMTDGRKLADLIAVHLDVEVSEKQKILSLADPVVRLTLILEFMQAQLERMKIDKKIRTRVKSQMEKTHREYYLNEQIKAIQTELGHGEVPDEMTEMAERIKACKFTPEARQKAETELTRLRKMSPMAAEAGVVRNYLDWLLAVPWKRKKRLARNIAKAKAILDADHYGLEKVKERVLEHLAVQARTQKVRGPILCLVGPPGVGKTSLGRSIARATGREFVRVSLGGVRDEAEIRGHRRTYIGSMPGRIIQSMKKARYSNPLFLLDEIDKLGADFRGDPASALLEVLDPEQNRTFNDHYLEIDYDLSDVMFVTTANSLNLPSPLLDRMEIIRIPGYTEDEKVEIAKRHLIPDLIREHGVKSNELEIPDDTIRAIIRYYSREAGVRNLKRELSALARKTITRIMTGEASRVNVVPDALEDFLGVRKFCFGETDTMDQIGMVTGLAWTETGGDLLTIEAVSMPGTGKMSITGNLRNVMKESIEAANSYVQARAPSLGINPRYFRSRDIHVHVPEGATPKDGPSAGIAMVSAIVSVLAHIPVRRDVAMTGEVTLRGRVLGIGGLKEKLLAALRGGIKTVLIPVDNVKDLAEIPDNVKRDLEIIPVETIGEVLKNTLTQPIKEIKWTEHDEAHLAGMLLGRKLDSDEVSGNASSTPH